MLDYCSTKSENKERYSYLANDIDDMNNESMMGSQVSMLDIYSILCEIFDVNIEDLGESALDKRFYLKNKLNKTHINQLVNFYEFKKSLNAQQVEIINPVNFQHEYEKFYEKFFDLIGAELTYLLETSKQHASLFKTSLLASSRNVKESFIEFVTECAKNKTYR